VAELAAVAEEEAAVVAAAAEEQGSKFMTHRRHRAAFTLVELILALALSVIVLGLLGFAIHFHLQASDSRRAHVEEAQLARALLRRIADDLVASVRYEPADFSVASEMAKNAPASAAMSGGAEVLDLDGDGLVDVDPSTLTQGIQPAAPTESIASSGMPPDVPGLYGNQYEMQIDISRLPRADEYHVATADGLSFDRPGDVKTVAYYLGDPEHPPLGGPNPGEGIAMLTAGGVPRGLVRRSLSRAVTSYAAKGGQGEEVHQLGEMIAPEVIALEFRYFDGSAWRTEWDTDTEGGLPQAVEIALLLEPRDEQERATAGPLTEQMNGLPGNLYRLVVRLPASDPVDLTPEAETLPTEEGVTPNEQTQANPAAGGGTAGGGAGGSTKGGPGGGMSLPPGLPGGGGTRGGGMGGGTRGGGMGAGTRGGGMGAGTRGGGMGAGTRAGGGGAGGGGAKGGSR